jgi:hypothetical protein
MEEELSGVTTHRRKRTSLFRRLIYFVVMVITGGGAGVGGWAYKDHPALRAVAALFMNNGDETAPESGAIGKGLANAVTDVIAAAQSDKPGRYTVKIAEVRLDPRLFTEGRTVDIQARVLKIDAQGRQTKIWESKTFGENLAVVGRDDLTAAWPNRPFEIDWSADDQVVVEVWDRKSGLFNIKQLKMALPTPAEFPLASGPHALEVEGRGRSRQNSSLNQITFQSRPSARFAPPQRAPSELAERPIVIK